jgi:glycosyltransferase involved in cell wall biosynthesis
MSEVQLPLVSIVTPTYNQAAFLPETIESVLAQDYPRIEYMVIDDGSTDETPEILSRYTGRLLWESHSNRGQTSTINKGWERSQGDIVTWLNSDDTYLPGAVTTAVNYFQQHPDIDIVFGDSLFTSADGSPIEPSKPQVGFNYYEFVAKCHNPIPQPSAFIRRSVIEDIGLLDPAYYYFMDWDFWLRAGIDHSIAYFPELLSTYRLHEASKTVAQAVKAAPELEYMYRKFFALPNLRDEIQRLEKEAMVNMFFTSGGYYLQGGNRKAARRMAIKAVQIYPGAIFRPDVAHKFLYCFLGGRPLYQGSRDTYYRAREILRNLRRTDLVSPKEG